MVLPDIASTTTTQTRTDLPFSIFRLTTTVPFANVTYKTQIHETETSPKVILSNLKLYFSKTVKRETLQYIIILKD